MKKGEAIKILKDFHGDIVKISKDFHGESAIFSVRMALETLHPELCESEDEKVRKTLKHYLEVRRCQTQSDEEYINCNNFLAWLEKQGKVVNEICKENDDSLTNEDEKIRKALIEYFNEQCDMSDWNGVYGYQVVAWLEKQGTSYTKRDVDDAFVEGMALAKNELDKQGEQRSVGEEIVEVLRTEYEKGRADAFAQMQKEWSEEDDWMKTKIIKVLLGSETFLTSEETNECIDWLKSLRQRYTWKPSDEQMEALFVLLPTVSYGRNPAFSLYNDLKKLKE